MKRTKHRILIAAGLVFVAITLTLAVGLRDNRSADLTALKRMGVPIAATDVKPKARMGTFNGEADCYRLACNLLEPGPQREALKRLLKADLYGFVQSGPPRSYGNGNTFLPGYIGKIAKPQDATSVLPDLAALSNAVAISQQLAYRNQCQFLDRHFVTVQSSEPLPLESFNYDNFGIAYFTFDFLLLVGIVEVRAGHDEAGNGKLASAASFIRQVSFPFEDNVDDRLLPYTHRNLVRLWVYATNCSTKPETLRSLVQVAVALPATKSLRSIVEGGTPTLLDTLTRAEDDPTAYLESIGENATFLTTNSTVMRLAIQQTIHSRRIAFENLPRDENDYSRTKDVLDKTDAEMKNRWPAKFLDFTFDAEKNACLKATWDVIDRRLIITGIRILQYHAANGAFPATPPGSAEDTKDPFSGAQFIYKPTARGFVLYSVGPDGHDDGGSSSPLGGKISIMDYMNWSPVQRGKDVVIEYPVNH